MSAYNADHAPPPGASKIVDYLGYSLEAFIVYSQTEHTYVLKQLALYCKLASH